MPSDPLQFMAKLLRSEGAKERLVATRDIPAVEGSFLEPQLPLPAPLRRLLKRRGLSKLYRHQALAIDAIRAKKHVTLVTPTASGKTLTCLLPVLETLLSKRDSKTLFLYPIKALAQDQLGVFNDYLSELFPESSGPRAAIYDGDSSSYQRGKMRQNPPALVLSNPDMLHLSVLPFHSAWGKFLSNLETVVIDEAHSYRGVFGAHVALALRRLRRVCHFYGSDPRFIFLSATIANPAEFSERLLGEATEVIAENGAPSAGRLLALWNPQASAYRESTDLFGKLVQSGFKTIAFTKARKITELMSRWTMESWPQLKNRVAAYRAGYLPAERRELEARLFSGELDGIISTSALELGIDVGGLDACVLVGFPGTMISTRQRIGRVGRDGQASLVFMVGLQDALDQYFMKHPESFFERVTERALIPVDNPVILAAHYAAAAAELPLTSADQRWFGPKFEALARGYWLEGLLRQGADGSFHSAIRQPHRAINMRSSGDSYMIEAMVSGKPRLIGTLEVPRVYRDGHPGAIYLHQGGQYEVTELDQNFKRVRVREVEADYYTEPRGDDQIEILEVLKRVDLGHVEWCFGRVRASEQVTGYVTKHITTQKILSEHDVAMPLHTYETRASWWVLPSEWRQEFAQLGHDFAGAIHALEHSQIAMLPVFAICDRWDLGGVSYWSQPQLDKPCIFIYDGHAGGAALAEQGFDIVKDWLEAVERLLKDCPCEEGCPACVQSPKCGNGNKPLDKAGALELTRRLLTRLGQGSPVASAPATPVLTPLTVEKTQAASEDVVFFDLETQFLADEVGGWGQKAAMKISVAVTYSSREGRFRQYTEGQIPELLRQLHAADLVVGFNVINFDYAVLQAYTPLDLSKLRTLDMLVEVTRSLGHRLKLDTLAQATLNAEKSADGIQAVKWWREGNLGDLLAYCQKDVEITRDLWEFGRKHGYLLYEDKFAGLLKAPVSW
jgi:DEAD/DEAH box helicase domain-containing protein